MMNQATHFCGGMMWGNEEKGKQTTLCKPLAQLKREHEPLRDKMNAFVRDAAEIGVSQEISDWSGQLAALKQKVVAFSRELDPHSEREEGALFPLMAKYIGRQMGPIAVMEYEHEQAKQNLTTFIEAVEQIEEPVNAGRAKEIVSYALQAHAILSDHFMKEENVLFPMAENLLNAEEKEELARAIGLS